VSPRSFLPDTIPVAEYRATLDLTWPQTELEVSVDALKHPVPATTIRSIHVQPAVRLVPGEALER
jgi:hypothetical protein